MSNAKPTPTPGPWLLDGYNMAAVIRCVRERGHPDAKHMTGDYEHIARCEGENWKANAALIAEAGTVYHETGMTPRQLADEYKAQKQLLNLAECLRGSCEQECAALTKQRDDLLAALEGAERVLAVHYPQSDTPGATIPEVIAIRAAIASAKGGAS